MFYRSIDLAAGVVPIESPLKIERISGKEFSLLASVPTTRSILGRIKRELAGGIELNKFIQRYESLLDVDGQKVKTSPATHPRGAELYVVRGEQIIGFMLLNFYSWDILAPQICIKVEGNNLQKTFSLKPFSGLTILPHKPELASELFIIWVEPAFRRAGIGRALFTEAINIIDGFLSRGDIMFLTVRSGLKKRESAALFAYLIEEERKANGEDSAGNVIISGVQVDAESVFARTGVDCNSIPVHPDAVAAEILSKQAGLQFIGYSNKTSAIYCKVK